MISTTNKNYLRLIYTSIASKERQKRPKQDKREYSQCALDSAKKGAQPLRIAENGTVAQFQLTLPHGLQAHDMSVL